MMLRIMYSCRESAANTASSSTLIALVSLAATPWLSSLMNLRLKSAISRSATSLRVAPRMLRLVPATGLPSASKSSTMTSLSYGWFT